MRTRILQKTIILFAGLAFGSVVTAAPITFFGEDSSPGGSLPAAGNAATAQASFLSNLTGVGVEDFESIAAGTLLSGGGFGVDFTGSSGNITGTLSAGGSNPGGVCGPGSGSVGGIGCHGYGRFATSGDQFIHTLSDAFSLTFSSAISAFGFYGTDFGDFNGSIELQLSGGGAVNLAIPHGNNNGNVLFFGFIDTVNSYTGISFANVGQTGTDVFGFDDMIIGDRQQISTVPEPSTLALFSLSLIVLSVSRRKTLFI